jgi:hypothetical protein
MHYRPLLRRIASDGDINMRNDQNLEMFSHLPGLVLCDLIADFHLIESDEPLKKREKAVSRTQYPRYSPEVLTNATPLPFLD